MILLLRSFVALLVMSVAVRAHSASIGLFSTPDCSSCNLVAPPAGASTFYIRALTEGINPDYGFVGAGLKVVGLLAEWSTIVTPNPQALAIGDPFGPSGAHIAFSSHVPGSCIDLYTVTLISPSTATDVALRVEGVPAGWNPTVCPYFVPGCSICDFVICVEGGALFVNSESECQVPIETNHWTKFKSLYR